MSRKQPTANQRGGVRKVSNDIIERLNRVDPGLGTLLANEINHDRTVTNERFQAAAGQRGTVTIAPQKRPSTGKTPPAIDVKGGQIVGGSWATEGDAFITLAQLRAFFTCERFAGHPSGFPGWFEECVEAEEAGVGGGGVIPWFFGYSVHQPAEADTDFVDAGTFGPIYVWPMILQETATVTRMAYYLKDVVPPTTIGTKFNFALYDRNYDLICETGEQIVPSVGGVFVASLGDTFTLDPGEYFYAFSSDNCVWLLSLSANLSVNRLLNNGLIGTTAGAFARKFAIHSPSGEPWTAMPSTLSDQTLEDGGFYAPIGLFEDDDV